MSFSQDSPKISNYERQDGHIPGLDQTKEVRTIILGLKVFAYIVEEARGANLNFKILVCSPFVWLARRASLKACHFT